MYMRSQQPILPFSAVNYQLFKLNETITWALFRRQLIRVSVLLKKKTRVITWKHSTGKFYSSLRIN